MARGRGSTVATLGAAALALAATLAGALSPAAAGAAQPAPPAEGPAAGPALSWAQAQARLLDRSDALAAAAAGVEAAQARAEAVRALGRRPEVTLDAQLLDFQKTLFLPLGPLAPLAGAAGLDDPLRFRIDRWVRRPLLTATWPLYAGGQMDAARAAAASQLGIEEAGRDDAEQGALAQLARAYFGRQLAAEALAIRRAVVAGVAEHVAAARALEREQQIARAQRLQAEAALEEAQREQEKAAADLAAADLALAGLLRLDGPPMPTTPLPPAPRPLPPVETFIAAARDGHPAVQRLKASSRLAEAGVAAEQARLRPSVYALAQYNFDRERALVTDPDFILGVGLKYQIIAPTSRRAQLGAARLTAEQAEAGVREALTQVETGIRVAHARAEAARRRHALYGRTIAAADEALRVARLSFRELQGVSRDVTDAQLQVGRVRVEQAQAAYEQVDALVSLLAASGQMQRLGEFVPASGVAP